MSAHLSELLDQAKWTVDQAAKRGAQGSRVTAERTTNSSLEWRDGKVDRVKESTALSLAVTLFVDGRYSANTTSDLRPAAVERFLDDAVSMTKAIAKDPSRALAEAARYADRYTGDLKLFDPATAAIAPDWRRRVAAELEAAARAAPGADKIISVSTSVENEVYEYAKVTSNGMEGASSSTSVSVQAETSVRDAEGKKPEGWWYESRVRLGALPSVQDVGRIATERAVARIGAARRPTGKYACVVEAMTAGRLIGALTSALGGYYVQQRKSFLAGKIGQKIGSDLLTVIDDPHVVEGMGSRTFDGEGMATRKRPMFEKGVLRSYYLDTYYARKLGAEPTSGGNTNLSWNSGKRDLAGLLQAMGTGILITGFNGGNSNSATGDFSFGIQGHWVEGGKLIAPLSEMNLAGNHLEFWKRLVELGNDPLLSSSNRRPSLRFDKVQFSGT